MGSCTRHRKKNGKLGYAAAAYDNNLPAHRLRIHDTQEWYDLYQPWANDDLQRFFDKYLKGIDNGWETTPRVRHSLLGYNCASIVNRPDSSYPPAYMKHTTLFLDCASGTLRAEQPSNAKSNTVSYQSDSWDDDGAHFTHKFETYTELIGYSKATLYMSCLDTDELDVYVILRKLDATGNPLLHVNIPLKAMGTTDEDPKVQGNVFKYVGPNGRLRASHRRTRPHPDLSAEQCAMIAPADIYRAHDKEEKISPGEMVRLEIPLWPSGIVFQAGEQLRLEVKGHEVTLPEFPDLYRVPKNLNSGRHVVYSGVDCPSSIVVPLSTKKPTQRFDTE